MFLSSIVIIIDPMYLFLTNFGHFPEVEVFKLSEKSDKSNSPQANTRGSKWTYDRYDMI